MKVILAILFHLFMIMITGGFWLLVLLLWVAVLAIKHLR